MSNSRQLYEQVIIDHNKKPRNFKALEGEHHRCEGYNPLCGDQFTVYVKLNGDLIEDIGFTGDGCAISKSAASVMTTIVKGKTIAEARALFRRYHSMVTAPAGRDVNTDDLGKLRVFSGVREFPIRIKCATLPWHTLAGALENKAEAVSTE